MTTTKRQKRKTHELVNGDKEQESSALAPIVPIQEPQSIMQVLARAATNPRVDVQKLQALLDMQVRVENRQAEVEFNAALARLMPLLPEIQKNGVIPDNFGKIRSRFARYEDIDRVTRPLLADEGFSISFRTEEPSPGHVRVIGTLAHRMGHTRESSITVPITAPPKASGTQAVGSSVSYAKRYIVTNMLNIVTVGDDTDGVDLKPISAEQVLTIETLLQDAKADRAKFLAWQKVAKLEEILADNFDACVKVLEAKGRQK